MLFTTLISNEYKIDKLKTLDADNFQGLDKLTSWSYHFLKKHKINENSFSDYFCDKYFDSEFVEEYKFYKSIYRYILTGYYNSNETSIELKSIEIPDQIIAQNNFTNFRRLESEEFDSIFNKVKIYFENGQYNYSQYPGWCSLFCFCNEKLKLNMTDDDIKKIFLEGIVKAYENQIPNHTFQVNMYEENMEYPIAILVLNKRKELNKKQFDVEKQKKLDELLELLTNDSEKYKNQVNQYDFGEFIKYVDIASLFNNLTKLKQENLVVFKAFVKHKFDIAYIAIHSKSLSNLKMLKSKIDSYIQSGISENIKLLNFQELSQDINEIVSRAEAGNLSSSIQP